MARERKIGSCEHCNKKFGYYLVHNGFSNTSYAYCDVCGLAAILDGYKVPQAVHMVLHQAITPDVESYLTPCRCGGSFRAGASPRCPNCQQRLSADQAANYIESQAEGTKKGWRWQRTWTGLYCIIIEDRVVNDVWTRAEA
jgi:hypothetical protein